MYELDHVLNGKGIRQHHQDILRWTQHERLACEVEAAQRSRKMGMRSAGIARRIRAALLNFTMAIQDRSARRDAADEASQVKRQGFAHASDS